MINLSLRLITSKGVATEILFASMEGGAAYIADCLTSVHGSCFTSMEVNSTSMSVFFTSMEVKTWKRGGSFHYPPRDPAWYTAPSKLDPPRLPNGPPHYFTFCIHVHGSKRLRPSNENLISTEANWTSFWKGRSSVAPRYAVHGFEYPICKWSTFFCNRDGPTLGGTVHHVGSRGWSMETFLASMSYFFRSEKKCRQVSIYFHASKTTSMEAGSLSWE